MYVLLHNIVLFFPLKFKSKFFYIINDVIRSHLFFFEAYNDLLIFQYIKVHFILNDDATQFAV